MAVGVYVTEHEFVPVAGSVQVGLLNVPLTAFLLKVTVPPGLTGEPAAVESVTVAVQVEG
jgi:hypothetical protein